MRLGTKELELGHRGEMKMRSHGRAQQPSSATNGAAPPEPGAGDSGMKTLWSRAPGGV